MNRSLFTGLMLALLLTATAFAQSGQSSSAQQGATGAQGTPASEPPPAGSAQQGAGAESSQEPSTPPTPPTPPSSRMPAGAPSGPGGAGAGAPSSELAATDKSFMHDAALGNLEAEELGRLAAEKASNPDVKSFGQKMADDHKQANDALKQVASSLQFEPPSKPSSRAKSEKARLEKLSGADFDREFLDVVVKQHQKDVSLFERESRRGAAPAGLKSFAGSTLKGLQDHIKMAQDLSSKLGAGSPGRPSSSQRP
jgi:putative membrane protein